MPKTLVWLRNDLRLSDNPALAAACKAGEAIALYIHETDAGLRPPGGAARWWLHHSLEAMGRDLAEVGVVLRVAEGNAEAVVERVAAETGAESVFWNRRYAPAARQLDAQIKQKLSDKGLAVSSCPGNVLAEPWTIQTGQGKPYSVFTPFWKTLKQMDIARPLPAPKGKATRPERVDQDYKQPHWAVKLEKHWQIGEKAARDRLEDFLDRQLVDYPEGRDFPAKDVTSRLSPHLRFGEISARQIW